MRKVLLILALVLASCADGGADGPVLTFADFGETGTVPTGSPDLSTTTTTLPPTTTTASPTPSTTLLVTDPGSPVLVMSDSGLTVLEGRGAPRRLVDETVAAAFDDLQGGLVLQLPGGGTDPAADQRVFWSRATQPDAEPFLDVTEGSLLRLWGTERINDVPHMILTITDDPDGPDRVERLVVYDFTTGDRVLGEVGGPDGGPVAITYGGGRFLLELAESDTRRFEFRNDQGAVQALSSNPQQGCLDDPTCPTHPVLDESGSLLAYVAASDLVVLDVDLDEEVRRIALPPGAGAVESLDLNGSTVLVNRTDGARALIVDLNGESVSEFGLDGTVQFLRDIPDFDEPIEILAS
ncbi:MAG: hypothetical protein HKN74_02355 [Acidimicrobiia bacterium]|nr:hypothetical protein [Acidimicrobiia bacterium]NNF09104.1 hypothetical protein [Acidimicrobiia bacterium]NNL69467.1 hypothetical protein [Acidimicrobiia bacterium]